MQVFISADMEGISGVATLADVSRGEAGYDAAAERMLEDVNAAVRAAVDAGATDVLVNDSHGPMDNLDPGELHPAASLIRGNRKPRSMMQGLGPDHDVAFLVGYHAMAGTPEATLDHTYLGSDVVSVRVNDREVGELGANAGLARSLGVPVGLVTGDDKTTAEADDELGDVATVTVKEGLDRFTAKCRPVAAAREDIEGTAREAVERARAGDLEQPTPEEPTTIEIDWATTNVARAGARVGDVALVDGRTNRIVADDYATAYEGMIDAIRASGAGTVD